MGKLVSRNPATGEIIRELDITPISDLQKIFDQAHVAQVIWNSFSLRKRSKYLLQIRETILNHADDIIELISKENGKPKYEALTHEVLAVVNMLTHFSKKAPKLLKNKKIHASLTKHRKTYLNYWPIGTVLIISPWNYPFLLPFADILMAIVAGNSVIFKPSEFTPSIGLKIQQLCDESGLPPNLVQAVFGHSDLGEALIQKKPGKIFFTGSTAVGKKIMAAAAEHLIPVNLELGGKNPMIILPDADLNYATSAAIWGSFCNAGQVCGSIERIIVHERISEPFKDMLKEKIERLRVGHSYGTEYDIGPITIEKQKQVYTQHLNDAKSIDAQLISGGEFTPDQRYLKPTVVAGSRIKEIPIYHDEIFGPITTLTTFNSIAEAVRLANENRYGLTASIIAKNLPIAESIAKQLEVGTVSINEVLYTGALPEAPWGGLKDSGIGRTHSDIGMYEYVNIRHIDMPKSRLFVFKSLWWYPYTPFQYQTFRVFLDVFRLHWFDKLKALPHFFWNFIKFIKEEKRL
jgi:succinate-semialdehyde dehydrogenase/glutarate-semialdehyde dehydrogenase